MKRLIKSALSGLTAAEWALWGGSAALIVVCFIIFDRESYLTLAASLLGVSSLIFNAKGNPLGQLLMVIFSVLYGIISYSFAYYGEMLTYLGMTAPMAVLALISWLRHPYEGNCAEVKVSRLRRGEAPLMLLMTAAVTVLFFFVLRYFNTANLLPSTISVTTSFLAVYLTFRRSAYFALAYAANDLVLIVLWVMAAMSEQRYISVAVCFTLFLINDLYGFICWRKMRRRQSSVL